MYNIVKHLHVFGFHVFRSFLSSSSDGFGIATE